MDRVAFVSYSREDAVRVETMKDRLTQLGFEVWLDKNLRGGQAWWDVILDKIRSCEVFVMIVSDASLQSHACGVERQYARALGKPVVPVAIAATRRPNPSDIQSLQIVDYSAPTDEAAFALVRALNDHEPNLPLPDPLPDPPDPPLSYLNRQMDLVLGQQSLSQDEQVGVLLTVRPGLRSSDPDERLSAWKVLEALDARADVTREASDEITRLRGQLESGVATPQARLSQPMKGGIEGGESTPAPRPPPAQAEVAALAGVWTVGAVGLLLALVARWAGLVALNLAWEYGLPDWAYSVQDVLYETQSFVVAVWVVTLGGMIYAGMARARGHALSRPSAAVRVAVGAALRSLPLVLLWTAIAVVLEEVDGLWFAAAMVVATAAGVVAQALREMGQKRKRASEAAQSAGGSR